MCRFTDIEPGANFGSGATEKPAKSACSGVNRRLVIDIFSKLSSAGLLGAAKLSKELW